MDYGQGSPTQRAYFGSKFREEKFGWKCAKWVYGRALVPPGRVAFPRGSKPPPARQQVETKRPTSCKPSGSDLPRYCNHDICFQLKLQSPKPPPLRALYQQTRGPLFTPRAPSAHRKEAGPLYPALHRKPRIITAAQGPQICQSQISVPATSKFSYSFDLYFKN